MQETLMRGPMTRGWLAWVRVGSTWLILLIVTGCQASFLGLSERAGLPPRVDQVRSDVDAAQRLFDLSLDWRGRAIRFAEVMGAQRGEALSSADLSRLYRGAEDYVFLQRRWAALEQMQGAEAWARMKPQLAANAALRRQSKLVLAAALIQHDNYALGVDPYVQAPRLRWRLRTDHPEVEGELGAAVRWFSDPLRRQRLAEGVVWFRAETGKIGGEDPQEAWLNQVIEQSPAYRLFTEGTPWAKLADWSKGGRGGLAWVTDLVRTLEASAIHHSSAVVGNAVGLVETRKGKLAALSSAEVTALQAELRPLDVLLEKTPFRLTDATIPGHYGHVALYLGDEASLRAEGVWDEPWLQPHHEQIRAGATIVEALRPGVEINSLRHFLNIDDFLVLRPQALTPQERREALARLVAQVGKAYDFGFDVQTDRKIVCSELAFVVFPDVKWEVSRAPLGYSITPDQVLRSLTETGRFPPQILFHDGVRASGDLPSILDRVVAGQGLSP